ncbi:probable potassium channel protein related protein [Thermoplasma acidophilum]|uniref:Probable potassium channel protein related protein n=1 Tax=Thermoplasma acidophilum (strain ATCC 25905 / DSM 1728 / JCM 9062 / NBRC 15155 / AMRC-C165) TaxID=273075 RepID=Q9HIA8_THEAC|nr:probable potassium channel protein related protein [Thermoplasma acidophilum]
MIHVIGLAVGVSIKAMAFIAVFDGFVLSIFGFLMKEKTKTAWWIMVSGSFITVLILAFGAGRHYHITILGMAFSFFVIFMLIRRRREYVYPARILGRPEVAIALVTIAFTILYGIGGSLLFGDQFRPPITDLGNAFYYTGEVITTLGFGDILPVTMDAKIFTISLAFLGVAIFFSSITALILPSVERRLGGLVNRMEKRELKTLKDYVLVCGFSNLLQEYLSKMKATGTVVVVIERDEAKARSLRDEGYIVFDHNADDIDLLSSFDFSSAREIIIGSDDDAYNLIIAAAMKSVISDENRQKVRVLVVDPKDMVKFRIMGFSLINVSSVLSDSLYAGRNAPG